MSINQFPVRELRVSPTDSRLLDWHPAQARCKIMSELVQHECGKKTHERIDNEDVHINKKIIALCLQTHRRLPEVTLIVTPHFRANEIKM